MRILIVEDDFICRTLLEEFLAPYGDSDIAVDGREAIQAFKLAWEEKSPYDLICMDIMMPNINGLQALETIREIETEMGIPEPQRAKAIVTSALEDPKTVVKAMYKGGSDAYIVKPVRKGQLLEEVRNLGLIGEDAPEPRTRSY